MDSINVIGGDPLAVKVAAKIFGKKFARTSKFIHTNKLWMHTIPTRDCDVLMTFPEKTDDDTLMWLLSRMRARLPELGVHVRHHGHTGVYGFYLTAEYENLLHVAEELALCKPLKQEYGGGLKEFTCEEESMFEGVHDKDTFLTSQERQAIVLHMLQNLRAEAGDRLGKIKLVEGQAIVPKFLSKGIISQVFPLHSTEDLHKLRVGWVQAFLKRQPLDDICDYYGVKIATYFAWLGHYTTALCWPALLGFILTFLTPDNKEHQDLNLVIFSVFNIIWATLYLESWKRRSAELAYQWGTLDNKHELIEDPRPLYTGNLEISPISGRLEPHYPAWKRNLFRYFVTMPIILLCLVITFAAMLSIFELQEWVNHQIDEQVVSSWVGFLPKILLALVINLCEELYKRIAHWLNDMENYRLQQSYENHLIIKLVIVQFVNNFVALFYIAFYLQDMTRLKQTLATIFITKQIIGNLKEAILPYVLEKLKFFKMTYNLVEGNIEDGSNDEHRNSMASEPKEKTPSENGNGKEAAKECEFSKTLEAEDNNTEEEPHEKFTLTQAEVESSMKMYDDTFEDYLEMFIQFGYVILFSSTFPIAAVCALLNNVIEVRSDAFKLCSSMQRPFGQRVQNIGTWQDAMEVMGVIAVIVNCALLGISGQMERYFPNMTATQILMFIIVSEHVILSIKFAIAYAIPDIPHWVSQRMAKLEFNRREALKKLEHAAMQSVKETKAKENETNSKSNDKSSAQNGSSSSTSASSTSASKPGTSEKKTVPRRVWPPSMTEAAANFNLYANREKTRFAPKPAAPPVTVEKTNKSSVPSVAKTAEEKKED